MPIDLIVINEYDIEKKRVIATDSFPDKKRFATKRARHKIILGKVYKRRLNKHCLASDSIKIIGRLKKNQYIIQKGAFTNR